MSVILIRIPDSNLNSGSRPKKCPHCESQLLQRWGKVTKPVKNMRNDVAVIYRYRCLECERTFRNYPDDLDRSSYSRSIRRLAAMLWALGFSYREITSIFGKKEIYLSRSTIWREGQEVYTRLSRRRIDKFQGEIKVNKSIIPPVSNVYGLVLAVGLNKDEYIILGNLNESNPTFVTSWLRPLLRGTNIEIRQFGTDLLDQISIRN